MKRNILQWTGIAALSALSLTACKPDSVKEEPILAVLLSTAVRGAAQGNCAISLNATALFFGNVEQLAINGASAALVAGGAYANFVTHYNNVNGTSIAAAGLSAIPYNKKYETFYTDKDSWNDSARASYLNTFRGLVVGGAPFSNLNNARGTAVLACGRIPRSSCSLGGLGTATRADDVRNAREVVNAVLGNPDCVKSTDATRNAIINAGLRGVEETTNLITGDFTPSNGSVLSFSSQDGDATGGYTHVEGNVVLASKAYPKIGALVSLGFGAVMPARTGTTAYALSASEYVRGGNVGFKVVDSCESLGLPSKGFTVTGTNDLTPVNEIIYAFSQNGAAAALYASATNANLTVGGQPVAGQSPTTLSDTVLNAYECNSSFRARTSIPLAVGGGRLPVLNGVSGDGARTRLLTACAYGNNATARANLIGILTTASDSGLPATLAGLAACPEAAAAGASNFGDAGLTNFPSFPNGE